MIEIKISSEGDKIKIEVEGKGYFGMDCIPDMERIANKMGIVLTEKELREERDRYVHRY